jgi:DNA polymerase-3 subunit epsilon
MYSIIDIESTGGKRQEESLIEIAIIKYNGNKILDIFSSLVKTKKFILPFVQKITGIYKKKLLFAPKFNKIYLRIINITENTILVGHNIKFDYYILKLEFERIGISFIRKKIDTIDLSKKIITGINSYSLRRLCKSLFLPIKKKHRALEDAKATLNIFKKLIKK